MLLRAIVFAVSISIGAAFTAVRPANAQCEPSQFMVKDVLSTQTSDTVEIAFVLTASESEFNEAKKNLGASGQYGLIGGSANYSEAQSKARKASQTIKFNYNRSYYSNYLSQQISGNAYGMYVACLDKDRQRPGLVAWLDKRQGDYYFVNAFWVGDKGESIAKNDETFPNIDSGVITQKPTQWETGKNVEVVVKKKPDADALLSFSVNGGVKKSLVLLKDPINVTMMTTEVLGSTLKADSYHVSGTVCGGGTAEACVTPQKPGGSLVTGTGRLTTFTAIETNHAGFATTVDTPERVCVRLTVSTGACEARNHGEGVVTALERYPVVVP